MEEFRVLKLGAVVIHIPHNIKKKLTFLTDELDRLVNIPVMVYEQSRINFLSDFSKALLSEQDIRKYPDVATFAFWCRASNLIKIINELDSKHLRVGLGLIYHNSPSNVPVNFAFSLAFGILSGNSSVVRLSSKESESAQFIINALNKLLEVPKYHEIKKIVVIIKFNHDDEVNNFWMSIADGRVIWGGDETVAKMRTYPCKPRAREVVFPDRFSLCAINAIKIVASNNDDLDKLCVNLFNDIYIMDQNACSSPQLLNWVGNAATIKKAKGMLWPLFLEYVNSRHSLEPIQYMNKYVDACKSAINNDNVLRVKYKDNLLFNIELSHFHEQQHNQRGYSGTIHEISIESLNELSAIVDDRYQTLTYYGFEVEELKSFIISSKLRGIDRIVPIGRSLDMSVIWDGYDIINHLSRIVDVY